MEKEMAAELNSVKVSKDDLAKAVEFLTEYHIDLENQINVGLDLAETTIALCDTLENHVLSVVSRQRTTRKNSGDLLGVITIDSLVNDIRYCENLLTKTEAFGNTRLSVKTMKTIRKDCEKIKTIALSINVEALIQSARNEI
jgi:hypothetical protein